MVYMSSQTLEKKNYERKLGGMCWNISFCFLKVNPSIRCSRLSKNLINSRFLEPEIGLYLLVYKEKEMLF